MSRVCHSVEKSLDFVSVDNKIIIDIAEAQWHFIELERLGIQKCFCKVANKLVSSQACDGMTMRVNHSIVCNEPCF